MARESVFLNGEEASSLKAAVVSIVSSGIRVQDADLEIPVGDEQENTGLSEGVVSSSEDHSPPRE